MNTETFKTYTSLASAKRGAVRGNIVNPIFETLEDGRIAVKFEVEAPAETVSTVGPIAKYRELFAANYGKLSWSDMIKAAMAVGIKENTAKTYYYKLRAENENASA